MKFTGEKFILIAGPCAIESEEICMQVAEKLSRIRGQRSDLEIVFKGSIDKANRSSGKSFRGIGIGKGLEILGKIRSRFSMAVTTDFHSPEQAKIIGKAVDIIQIPAFLCRQTDMLQAAAEACEVVSVKKGQFLSPWDMRHVVEKLRTFGARKILQMERGTSFGYGSLVVDMRSFQILHENNCPVIYDLTHSLQLPGMGAETTRGAREFADTLARAAIGAGIDGLFIEVHPNPPQAQCDAETQLPLKGLEERLDAYLQLHLARKKCQRSKFPMAMDEKY
ncbi:MAG: 3-deoxy-8-phosphooctulonate synthase [Puniceicoccales bacterium]|jgi:2-dehydro-3-deoxyphosphooctonate aldolase (KDO 8-P synthase)|nr:3-deoxy-8-phosphooctulonate synthase [Puniceicoccales bacterium]